MAGPNYNLSEFLTQMDNNQVRTNTMFYLSVSGAPAAAQDVLDTIQVYGQSFTVPNRSHEYSDITYRGYQVPIPTTLRMENQHSITLNCDSKNLLRDAFLSWQSQNINASIYAGSFFESDRRPTLNTAGQDCKMRISLLAPDYQSVVEEITLHGVRVESVGNLSLSNTDGGVTTFDVGLRSVYWETTQNYFAKNEDARAYTGNSLM